jgi:homoserine kinase type II
MAVYTEVTDDALRSFLGAYDLGELIAFRGIAEGVENSNYALKTDRGDFILTLYERRVDPGDLPYFLGLMQHLAASGVSCPRPVAARDGAALRRLADRHAAITTFLPGVWPRSVRQAHCGPVGAALAGLHLAGADYPVQRANALGPAGWPTLLAHALADGGAAAEALSPGLGAELAAALARILAAWPQDLPRGHIHGDLFPDNVFFLGGEVSGLIDFYFAATDLYAYDLAVCLNAWCFEPDLAFNVTKARALLGGYARVRPLVAAELAALPVLAQGAALRFALTRLYDWVHTPPNALVTRKDPRDYLRRLRFHLAAHDVAAYGL